MRKLIVILFFLNSGAVSFGRDTDYIVSKGGDTTYCIIKGITDGRIYFIYNNKKRFYHSKERGYLELANVLGYKKGSEEFIYIKVEDLENDTAKYLMPKNTIYAEVLGAGLLYSFNYERLVMETKKRYLWLRIGISPVNLEKPLDKLEIYRQPYNQKIWWVFPAGLSIVYKRVNRNKRFFFEQGIYPTWLLQDVVTYKGTTFIQSSVSVSGHLVGFRVQPKNQKSGFYLRSGAGVMLRLFDVYYHDIFFTLGSWLSPLIAFSFGYVFDIKINKKHEK